MTKEDCKGCGLLGTMNTRDGKKDCCRWFSIPVALDEVVCTQTQCGLVILVEPKRRKSQ